MDSIRTRARWLEGLLARPLAAHQDRLSRLSVDLLRLSLGLVFLLFGALKFISGISPAEEMATEAFQALSFGLVPDEFGRIAGALLETTIGLTLLTGRYLRLGLLLLGGVMVGILSPLVLFPGELFAGPFFAPTLEGQYVIKDVILLAAALVVAVKELARRPTVMPVMKTRQHRSGTPRSALRLKLDQGSLSRG
ncbi:MAG: DoxX family membrane protein [Chloroflexota bacterium]|nr:DoxX family membrane protein [Chloroflexota bacterium]